MLALSVNLLRRSKHLKYFQIPLHNSLVLESLLENHQTLQV